MRTTTMRTTKHDQKHDQVDVGTDNTEHAYQRFFKGGNGQAFNGKANASAPARHRESIHVHGKTHHVKVSEMALKHYTADKKTHSLSTKRQYKQKARTRNFKAARAAKTGGGA